MDRAEELPSPVPLLADLRRIGRGFQIQFTVIHALVLRETRTRFGLNRLGYFWAVFEPVSVILTFFGAFYLTSHAPPTGMGLVGFIATGLLPYELVMNTAERGAEAINGNRSMLFYPQVHRLDLIWARSVLEAVTLIVVSTIILGTEAFILGGHAVDDWLGLLVAITLGSMLGTGLGLVFCMASVLTALVDRIRGVISRPLFWVSGIFFTADSIPHEVAGVARWNPILHVIELVRDALYPSYTSNVASEKYVLGWALGLLALGLVLERKVRTKIEVAG